MNGLMTIPQSGYIILFWAWKIWWTKHVQKFHPEEWAIFVIWGIQRSIQAWNFGATSFWAKHELPNKIQSTTPLDCQRCTGLWRKYTNTHTIVGDGRSMQKSFFCQISMAQKRVVNSATTLVACGTYIYIYIILYYISYHIISYHIILYYITLY